LSRPFRSLFRNGLDYSGIGVKIVGMKRSIESYIRKDLENKIVLVTGPRQCGKTTLAKQLYPEYDYFNYDSSEDRLALNKKAWDRSKTLIIFDELHKKKDWKRWIKGIYDTENIPPKLLVTGSARLDVHRRVGDSLAGRYFQYRLHPLDLKEAKHYSKDNASHIFEVLWNCSGFPEPFFKGDEIFYKRWRRSHLDIILRQDLVDLYTVRDVTGIETLVSLLKESVGSTISYSNLARTLERDPNTIKRWLQLLENLYIIFRVTPYHKNIARSLLKEPKYYFYDHTYANPDNGARLENIVACALLKELQFIEDTTGAKTTLHFLRTKDGKELDFLILQDKKPTHVIEVKTSDDSPAKAFNHFSPSFPHAKLIQLVKTLKREKSYPEGLRICSLVSWLADLNLH
jgi:predicted AAA+ superfamily ATPase